MALEVEFIRALTGEHIGSVVVSLPWSTDVDQLSAELSHSVHGYLVQTGGEPLRNFVANSQQVCLLSELQLAPCPSLMTSKLVLPVVRSTQLHLRNLREVEHITLFPGWRRWYREFRKAASEMPLLFVNVPKYAIKNGFHCLDNANVRPLVAIILQAVAAESRERRYADAGRRRRSWSGCKHALVRRAGLSLHEVNEFINKWLQVHSELVDVLVQTLGTEVSYIA